MFLRALAFAVAALLVSETEAVAGTIHVGPGDDYTKIEAAGPGDTVLIAPGTYHFRVFLDGQGTADKPITIEAEDPTHKPVFDLGGMPVNQWPGSYTGGDDDRGCWQVFGAHYIIEGIELENCHNGIDAAGIRTHASTALEVRDVYIHDCDDGFTGDGDGTAVEFSEIANNGDPSASQETHNIYIYGGSFALRYSYVHDSTHGQNFHIRASSAVLEYNWIARARNYEGDLMPTDPPGAQSLLLRGNVILGNANPENHGQVLALYNDAGTSGYSFTLEALWNTIVIQSSGDPALVAVGNDMLDAATVTLSNNIVTGTTSIVAETAPSMGNVTVSGANNWLPSGADASGLTGSIHGASPGFHDAAGKDFTLAPNSVCIGAAKSSVSGAPDQEYYRDETLKERFRYRLAVRDVGAFEHDTSGKSYGPYDNPTPPGSTSSGAGGGGAGGRAGAGGASSPAGGGEGGASASGGGGGAGSSGGCGCDVVGERSAPPAALVALVGALLLARRRRCRAVAIAFAGPVVALASLGCSSAPPPIAPAEALPATSAVASVTPEATASAAASAPAGRAPWVWWRPVAGSEHGDVTELALLADQIVFLDARAGVHPRPGKLVASREHAWTWDIASLGSCELTEAGASAQLRCSGDRGAPETLTLERIADPKRVAELEAIVAKGKPSGDVCPRAEACCKKAFPLLGATCNPDNELGRARLPDKCDKFFNGIRMVFEEKKKPLPPECK